MSILSQQAERAKEAPLPVPAPGEPHPDNPSNPGWWSGRGPFRIRGHGDHLARLRGREEDGETDTDKGRPRGGNPRLGSDSDGRCRLRFRKHCAETVRKDTGGPGGRALLPDQPQWHASVDHDLRRNRRLAHRARSRRPLCRRRSGIRPAGGLPGGTPLFRGTDRPLRQPHRQGPVHPRRHALHACRQRWGKPPAWRHPGIRQGRLAGKGGDREDGARGGPGVRQRRRRRGLSRQPGGQGRLHPDRQQRAEDRVLRHDGQAHAGQPHEPLLLQPRRAGLGRHPGPRIGDRRRPFHPSRQGADSQRRTPPRRGHAV